MSTMYYILANKEKIGQVHNLGRDKGYHFTWCIYPLDFAMFYNQARMQDIAARTVIDEHGEPMMLVELVEVVRQASSQSFDDRIE